jgi:surface carbohydrate biosynthesis protein
MLNYSFQYLTCVNPIVALTYIDNNHLFYQLKSHQKDLTTIFVQNGVKGELGDVFGLLKMQTHIPNKHHVDYMLTFGNVAGRKYSEYIEGKTISIGSFKNNLHQSKPQKPSKFVLFISQYRSPPQPESRPVVISGNQKISWKQFYSAEEFILPLLQQYCLQNNLKLKICMCSADQTKEESNYFISLLGNETVELLKRTSIYSGYDNVDAAEFVVFVDSALGYESLARGKKSAAFTLRGESLGSTTCNFGWPADIPDSGPFWTNRADEREFNRVMDYITSVSDEDWEQTRQRYIPELMEYDPGNTRFLKLMREVGVPLKPEHVKDVYRPLQMD